MSSALLFQVQSFCILALMVYGATQARQRLRHIKLMSAAIAWDLLLILQIELTRNAVAKAMKVVENPTMLKVHLFFALGSVLLYIVMAVTGTKVYKGRSDLIRLHKRFGITTLIFRALTLATSFYAA